MKMEYDRTYAGNERGIIAAIRDDVSIERFYIHVKTDSIIGYALIDTDRSSVLSALRTFGPDLQLRVYDAKLWLEAREYAE